MSTPDSVATATTVAAAAVATNVSVSVVSDVVAAVVASAAVEETKNVPKSKSTESLSAEGNQDIEQYSGVSFITYHTKTGERKVFLLFGVFFRELDPIEPEAFKELKLECFTPATDYGFCIFSVDEFIQDVLIKGNGYIFWPRTNFYYQIPDWYKDKIPKGLKALREASSR